MPEIKDNDLMASAATRAPSSDFEPTYPDDQLATSSQVRTDLGGISEPTFWRWQRYRGFPGPYIRIGKIGYWRWGDVRRWKADMAAKQREAAE